MSLKTYTEIFSKIECLSSLLAIKYPVRMPPEAD